MIEDGAPMADLPSRQPPSVQAAFWNAWNLFAVAATLTVAAITRDPWLVAAGAGLEAVWMGVASQSPRVRRALRAQRGREAVLRTTQDEIGLLPSAERLVVQQVASAAAEIQRECRENPRLGGELLAPNLDRLEETVAEYVHLSVLAHRCDLYLARADATRIARERDEWKAATTSSDEAARMLAEQNVAVLDKRLAMMGDIRAFVTRARAQLALVQNTVGLLRDQVLTLSTPRAVTRELDSLVSGLDAIHEATREVESALEKPAAEAIPITTSDGSESTSRPRVRS